MIIPAGKEFTPFDTKGEHQKIQRIERVDNSEEMRQAFRWLCVRLGRDPDTSEEDDTISMRSAAKALVIYRSTFIDIGHLK